MENLKELCIQSETKYQHKLQELEALKKSLLQKAFAGGLTSPERTQYGKDGRSPSDKKDGRSPSDKKDGRSPSESITKKSPERAT